MKLITVRYEDTVDISAFSKGTVVTLSSGSAQAEGGVVLAVSDIVDVEPVLVPHTHGLTINGTVGPAQL